MIYLEKFDFASQNQESGFFSFKYIPYGESIYPFKLFTGMEWDNIKFADITIFYGGNGSGKSTALNVIAEMIGAERGTLYNRSRFFEEYIELCRASFKKKCRNKVIIASDSVFDCMLDLRRLNMEVDYKRENLFDEYRELKKEKFQLKSIDQIEHLRKINAARRLSAEGFARANLNCVNVRELSNGESALQFFANKIDEDGIYLLDEPENSLSPEKQLELVRFLADSVRFYNCQFIIATHSPFLLSMDDAIVYDLEERPVCRKKWTKLKNMEIYREFFKQHEKDFLR